MFSLSDLFPLVYQPASRFAQQSLFILEMGFPGFQFTLTITNRLFEPIRLF